MYISLFLVDETGLMKKYAPRAGLEPGTLCLHDKGSTD